MIFTEEAPHVYLNKESYYPGETIEGELRIDSQSLLLKIYGNEQIFIQESDYYLSKGTQKILDSQYSESVKENRLILEEIIPLQTNTEVAHFAFQLPKELPASFHFNNICFNGSITYCLAISNQEGHVIETKEIKILQQPKPEETNIFKQIQLNLKSSQKFIMGVVLTSNTIKLGDNVQVRLQVDNTQTRTSIKRIEALVRQVFTLKSQQHKTQLRHVHDITRTQIRGVERGKALDFNDGVIIHLPMPQITQIKDDTEGTLISAQTQIQIRCVSEGCFFCCQTLPSIEIPLQLII